MEILENYQRRLFPFAYNILGTVDDANDVVQDVILQHIEGNRDDIENEHAYLVKGVINKSINLKKRSKKMSGDATWLPEPIATEDADHNINRQEIIGYSILVLLEYLKPRERAVFILKEAFDYTHEEIAQIFSFSIESSRQLLSRAKKTLKQQDVESHGKEKPSGDFIPGYIHAIQHGEVEHLERLLTEDISAHTDGGGKIKVLSQFSSGVKAVAQLAVEVYKRYLKTYRIEITVLNHAPALLFHNDDILVSCQIFDVDRETGRIRNIYSVVDPDKLRSLKKR